MKDNLLNELDKENIDTAEKIIEDSDNLGVMVDENLLNNAKMTKRKSNKLKRAYKIAAAMAACVTLIIVAGELSDKQKYDENVDRGSKVLESVDESLNINDYSQIYERLIKVENENNVSGFLLYDYDAMAKISANNNLKEASVAQSESEEFYNTNEQTENVHEGDIVKTDGEYVYTLGREENCKIVITKVEGMKMKIFSEIILDDKDDYYFEELYVSDNRLIVVGSERMVYPKSCINEFMDIRSIDDVNTIVQIYDINDRKKPKLISENNQEGSYSDSRLSGDILYLISTHSMTEITPDECVPKVNDKLIECDCIYLPEHIDERIFTVITTLDINDAEDYKEMVAVAGGITELYASEENLYLVDCHTIEENITDTKAGKKLINIKNTDIELVNEKEKLNKYDKRYIKEAYPDVDVSSIKKYKNYGVYTYTEAIEIVKYHYNKEKIEFVADVIIEGYIEDNLSFDEEKGYLRFVTTTQGYTNIETRYSFYDDKGNFLYDEQIQGVHASTIEDTNNIFVLDENLNEKAHISGLAKNERIYSARYYGDYGYFVTFRETDPLFSVDFSDIENPKVIGQLKIPGFSEYLHFYKDDKLLGLGIETENEGDLGTNDCLKMEMYDISNGSAKKESKCVLEEFEYAEALYNYRAIMVDATKEYIGFSVNGYNYSKSKECQYYVLYTYKDNKFQEILKVELDADAYSTRGFYIGDYLYIVSQDKGIKAVNLLNYNEKGSISELSF